MTCRYNDLEYEVIRWATERDLLGNDANPQRQALKAASEMGELCDAVAKNDEDAIVDGIGDTVVTLIILAEQYDIYLTHCLQKALDEIADRKGKTVDGVFIKET
jgi:NTP pyrophosphatase (non-canonical NTP hydrolase)